MKYIYQQLDLNKKFESFSLSLQDRILKVCLNREKPDNTMNQEFFEDLYNLFRSLNYSLSEDIRCVLIVSSAKNFSYGLDLKSSGSEIFSELGEDHSRNAIRLQHTVVFLQKSFN